MKFCASPLRLESLPAIDAYEDFSPTGESLYHRVLLPVETVGGQRLAWTYVVAGDAKKRQLCGARLIPQWPVHEHGGQD